MKPAVAIKTLTQNGLKKLKATSTSIPWTLPDDAKTCEKLADFSKAAAAHRAAARKVKQVSKETTKDSDILSKAEARYTELKNYSDKPATIPHRIAVKFRSQQDLMQAIETDMNNQVNTINTLRPKLQGKFVADMPPELKAAIVDWMTARNNLILATIPAKPIFDDLDKQYRTLAEDADVAAALKSLGKKNHLGSPEFEQDQKSMAESEATAMSGDVPFYREGAYDSVGALLNDSLPIIVRIESVNPQALSWAPAELLIKSGIKIDPAAPSATLTFNSNGKRVVECRQVTVPKLRIGKYVLENLKFLAMPDDAKDLGTQIVNSELKSYDQNPPTARPGLTNSPRNRLKPSQTTATPQNPSRPKSNQQSRRLICIDTKQEIATIRPRNSLSEMLGATHPSHIAAAPSWDRPKNNFSATPSPTCGRGQGEGFQETEVIFRLILGRRREARRPCDMPERIPQRRSANPRQLRSSEDFSGADDFAGHLSSSRSVANAGTLENWRPPAFKPPSTRLAMILAGVRRFFDLQAGSIWRDVAAELPYCRGVVLDVGCGAQPHRPLLNRDAEYVAIDTVDAKEHFGYEIPNTRYFSGDRWPVADETIDLVLCTEVLEHVLEPLRLLQEARRCLRPDGRIMLTVPFAARWHFIPHDYWRYTPSSLKHLLTSAGFNDIAIYARGNAVTVASYKVMALLLPLLMPQHGNRWVRLCKSLLLAVPLAPIMISLACIAQMSLRWPGGDDCLGYTALAAAG